MVDDDFSLLAELAKIDNVALDKAVEAATQAHVAGLEEHDQLLHGIAAYLFYMRMREREGLPSHYMPVPRSIEDAQRMVVLGNAYIERFDGDPV